VNYSANEQFEIDVTKFLFNTNQEVAKLIVGLLNDKSILSSAE
jgi:hypothetical protein